MTIKQPVDHRYTNTEIHMHVHTCVHTCKHTNTHTHNTHEYTHMYTQVTHWNHVNTRAWTSNIQTFFSNFSTAFSHYSLFSHYLWAKHQIIINKVDTVMFYGKILNWL